MKIVECVLDLIMPRDLSCALCGSRHSMQKGTGLCRACLLDMERDAIVKVVYRRVTAYCALEYKDAAKELIHGLKYSAKGYNAYVLGSFMERAVCGRIENDAIIVPVPRHITRYLKWGFNPVCDLACELSRRTGKPVVHALKKVRRTARQTDLDRLQRQENLKGAFRASERKVKGRNVLLTDDVLTTASTCRECALVLLAAGAKSVTCVTAACSVLGQTDTIGYIERKT